MASLPFPEFPRRAGLLCCQLRLSESWADRGWRRVWMGSVASGRKRRGQGDYRGRGYNRPSPEILNQLSALRQGWVVLLPLKCLKLLA